MKYPYFENGMHTVYIMRRKKENVIYRWFINIKKYIYDLIKRK